VTTERSAPTRHEPPGLLTGVAVRQQHGTHTRSVPVYARRRRCSRKREMNKNKHSEMENNREQLGLVWNVVLRRSLTVQMSHKACSYTVHLLFKLFWAPKSEYYTFEKRPTFCSLKKFFPSYFLQDEVRSYVRYVFISESPLGILTKPTSHYRFILKSVDRITLAQNGASKTLHEHQINSTCFPTDRVTKVIPLIRNGLW
jgi:hypothetical protein